MTKEEMIRRATKIQENLNIGHAGNLESVLKFDGAKKNRLIERAAATYGADFNPFNEIEN